MTGYSAVIANLVNAERREADWRGMMELVRSLEQRCGEGIFALSRRLKHLIQAMVEMPRPPLEAHNAVSLMTIHSAKGLEWPCVIVPECNNGVWPRNPEKIANEDRRVFLVAITRYREQLYLLTDSRREPSVFLEESGIIL